MRTAGIDIGSVSSKAVILHDGEILSWSLIPTGPDSAETAKEATDIALQKANLSLDKLDYIVSTGYGRVVVPFAHHNVTEISCHAKGSHALFPEVRMILDMGGQDCKAIRCNEKGKVVNFLMNDKCAAGVGRSMEVMADLLNIPLEDIGPMSLDTSGREVSVSSTCVLFARSEVLAYRRQGVPVNEVLAGLCSAMADRIFAMLKKVGIESEFVISGGIGKNTGVVRRVEDRMGLKANISTEPQIAGALGAALFAGELLSKQRSKSASAA